MDLKGYITYGRVSTDKQEKKGYSLRDQDARFDAHFQAHGLVRLQHFQDKVSAKNFFRPGWQELIAYVKKNLKQVAGIYIVSWDRFSRNITESFAVIKQLEELGLTINAIEQPIDHSAPESIILQAMYLATPDAENRRRSEKTRSGMRRAMKEGRWVNNAPIGYSHSRDELNKPIIVPNEEAPIIARAFRMISEGYTQAEARQYVLSNDRPMSKTNMSKLLRNPVYMGYIHIPEWKDEAAQTVKGIHQAIIEPELWYEVQETLSGRVRKKNIGKRQQLMPELPLRGMLYCSCGNKMTGSGSRSHTGTRYFYYHCFNCSKTRYRADVVNEAMEMQLAAIQFDKTAAAVFLEMCRDLMQQEEGKASSRISVLQQELEATDQRLHALEDKMLDGIVEDQDYQTMRGRLTAARQSTAEHLNRLKELQSINTDHFAQAFNVLGNLYKWYRGASVENKQLIVGSIFPGKIHFDGKKLRTPEVNEVVQLITNTGVAFRIAEKRKGRNFAALSSTAARSELSSNFYSHLQLVSRLNIFAA